MDNRRGSHTVSALSQLQVLSLLHQMFGVCLKYEKRVRKEGEFQGKEKLVCSF